LVTRYRKLIKWEGEWHEDITVGGLYLHEVNSKTFKDDVGEQRAISRGQWGDLPPPPLPVSVPCETPVVISNVPRETVDIISSVPRETVEVISNVPRETIGETSGSPLDSQVGGTHYDKAIQPVEYIHANKLPFIEGNVVKYITRWRDKNGLEDLEKIKEYIDLLIHLEKLKAPQITT